MLRPFVLAAIFLSLGAQRQEPFRTRVDLVQVDVVVTDGQGRVVKGLTQDDFELLVEDEPVPIVGFDAVALPETVAAPAVRQPDDRSGALVAANDVSMDGRILVLALDDLFTRLDARRVYRTKLIARDIIRRLGPRDRLALLGVRGRLHHRVEFTNDPQRLEEALAGYFPSGAEVGADGQAAEEAPAEAGSSPAERFLYSLRNVVRALREVPHRRKGLIVIGEASMFVVGGYSSSPGSNHSGIAAAYGELLDEAARANVAVYSFSAGEMDMHPLGSYTLRYISNDTGGRSWVNMNEHLAGVEAMYEETGNYYLLGFQPGEPGDEKFRGIKVKVRRPGMSVRARRGFGGSRPVKSAAGAGSPDRLVALPLATPALPLRVAAVPIPSASPSQQVLTVVEVSGAPLATAKELAMTIIAIDRDGRVRGRDRYRAALTGSADPNRWLRIAGRLELPPGWYQLRVAVQAGDAGGSLFSELEVPSPKGSIEVGGLALGTSARGVTRGATVQSLLPVIPIATREVPSQLRASAALRLRIAKATPADAVRVRGELLQPDGTTQPIRDETIQASTITRDGRAEVFPLAENLTPGKYTLRVVIGYQGAEYTRELTFTIVQ